MSMMKKLLEAMTKFAGEPEQKPGEQWKGTDPNPPGKKLVGDSIIRDLSKGPTPKTKEQELAEEWAKFNEADLGVEEKRPAREGARPSRDMGKSGEPSKRYNKVKDQGISKEKETKFHKKLDTLVHDTFGKRQEELNEATRDEEWQGWVIRYETAPKVRGQSVNWMAYSKKRGPQDAHKGTAAGPKEAVEAAKAWILSGGNAKEITTNKPVTIDFNVKFSSGIVNGNKFYANIVKGPTLIISDSPAPGLKPSSVRNRKSVETNETTPLAVIGLSGAEARAAGLKAHGRYKLGDTQQNQDGSVSYPLIYQSPVQAKGDTVRLPYPALTVATERDAAGLEEGWHGGSDRVHLPEEPSTYWSGTGALQKEYDELYEKLVPASGPADTIEGEVLRAASKIVYRFYNDGDEFNAASFNQLKPYIGTVANYDDLAHKATEFAIKADGNYHPNAGWDCLDVMEYGPADYDDEDDDEEDVYESVSATFDNGDAVTLKPEYADTDADEIFTVSQVDNERQRCWISSWHGGRGWYVTFDQITLVDDDEWDEPLAGADDDSDLIDDESLWEGAADQVYTINIVRERMMGPSSTRTTSGTLSELLDYFSYTLETGKSYERERGRYKINMTPKNIQSLVDNVNKAKSNAAANGHSSTYYEVADAEVAEGRGPSKGLHKQVKIVKGRDAGKTGWVRQIKTDKLRNRVYLDLDLEDGGQAVVLKQDVRLVKDLAEGYTGRETKDGVWRVFKDGQAVAAAGPFKSAEEANSWIKKQNQGVAEARTTWNNDFYVYDPKTKVVKKKFRTHKGAKQYAEANGLKVASAEYYHDTVSKEVDEGMEEFAKSQAAKRAAARKERSQTKEGWESGPEERTRVERDPDVEYDARRQEKLDAPFAKKEPEAKGYQVVSLDTRKPVTDKVFPTKGHAMAYIQSNHGKNLAFRAISESSPLATQMQALRGQTKRERDDTLGRRDELMYDYLGRKLPQKSKNKVLSQQINLTKGTHGPKGKLPEETLAEIDHSQDGYEPWGAQDLKPGEKALKGKPVKAKSANSLAKDAFTKAFGGTSKDLTKNLSIRKGVTEDIESADPVESAILAAVQELIQQGHTEVAPEVITNMVVAATSQPFLLKDLVDANNNSPAIQHYVDSINPTKVKFSSDILTVKNEDPAKDKAKAQAGVSAMASRAASRSRLGEGNTPLRNKDDYDAKRKALQDLQLDPDTSKDPELKDAVVARLASLNKEYAALSSKINEFKESRGHKAIATKLANMDRMKTVQIPTPAERQEQIRIAKEKEQANKEQVKEFVAPGNPGPAAKPVVNPAAAAKTAAATSTIKSATGTTASTQTLDKALDSATQGTATSTDVKALAPIMSVVDKAAQDPKLAAQFKNLANQAKTTP